MKTDIDTDGMKGMQDAFDPAKERRFSDKENYVLSWLTAPSGQLRTPVSSQIDMDKRFDTLLSVLHKERRNNVLPFKKPIKK